MANASTINMPRNFLTLQNGLVGWWTFDGSDLISNVRDRSGSNNNGVMSGFTSTSTAVTRGKIGQGLKFDGANDYVAGPSYNGVRTVSFWLKPNTTTQEILSLNSSLASTSLSSGIVSANNWTSPVIYVDGAQSSSIPNTNWHFVAITTGTAINASGIQLGKTGPGYLNGALDDVRIYNRVLSASEIKSLYNMGAGGKVNVAPEVPNLKKGLVGYWTFDGKDLIQNVADRSGSGNTGYMKNFTSTSSASVIGKIGQGLKFDGADNYINTTSLSNLSFIQNTLIFTISAWIKLNNTTVRQAIIGNCASRSWKGFVFIYETAGTGYGSKALRFEACNAGPLNPEINGQSPNNTITDLMWHHVIVTSTGAGNNLTFYVDGQALVTTYNNSYTSLSTGNSSVAPLISANNFTTITQFFNGAQDDIRIYNRALSASEIKQLYLMGK